MPSFPHEMPLYLGKENPEGLLRLLQEKQKLPSYSSIQITSSDFSQLIPTEYRADLVYHLLNPNNKIESSIIIESQLGEDIEKEFSWFSYVCISWAKTRKPVYLFIFTFNETIEKWAKRIIASYGNHPSFHFLYLAQQSTNDLKKKK